MDSTEILNHYREITSLAVSRARALPSTSFVDDQVYALEQQRIFASDWQFACPAANIAEPGSYFAGYFAGEAVVIIRQASGELRALSNLCRHRGTPLLDSGFGRLEKAISCPYHAWSYDHQGRFKGAPFCGKVKLDASEYQLPQLALEVWQGLVFIHLGTPRQSLAERYAPLNDYFACYQSEGYTKSYIGATEHWQANWKLIYENAVESYHLFKVHGDTLETVTPTKKAYYVAGNSQWTATGGELALGFMDKLWIAGSPTIARHYLLFALPPSLVIVLDAQSLSWISLQPENSHNSVLRSGYLSQGKQDKAEQKFTEAFFAEDKAICERLQQGMHGRFQHSGQLVEMERPLADFHHYLAQQLFGQQPSSTYYNEDPEMVFNQS